MTFKQTLHFYFNFTIHLLVITNTFYMDVLITINTYRYDVLIKMDTSWVQIYKFSY